MRIFRSWRKNQRGEEEGGRNHLLLALVVWPLTTRPLRNPCCQRTLGDSRTLGGHRADGDRGSAEEAGLRPGIAAGEVATRTAGGNSPGSLVVSREAAQRGVRSPAREVLRAQASAVSNPASNWGGVERGRGLVGGAPKFMDGS